MTESTLLPGSWPPSWLRALRHLDLEFLLHSPDNGKVTPNGPGCDPFDRGVLRPGVAVRVQVKRSGLHLPRRWLLRPPRRFMAMASVHALPSLMELNDMALGGGV